MKKITLLAAFFAAFAMNAQTVLFEDDFESYDNFIIENVGDYTLVDVDGLPTYGFTGITYDNSGYTGAFIVFNSTATAPPLEPSADSDWSARSGEKAMACFAAVPDGAQFNDDWLISPAIELGASGNTVEFWAKAADATYSDERFNVGVSTTGTDPGDFSFIASDLQAPAIDYTDFSFDLDFLAGETVYIAINVVSEDQFGFVMDDFKVTSDVLSVNEQSFDGFEYFVDNNNLKISADRAFESVNLFNVLGQEVVSKNLSNTSEVINIASLQSGVYITTVTIDGAKKSFKIVKQ
ncbi:T9SS-dependent choice-of-anchor J family protein [Marixanthomonas ophiurae]|uniref:T9SS C-terminal target domain-containing protein n=1 Tax=Marixanthomonas ophiurae TaxID=387659 RepID=A0A3E1QC89_9FLAO|nr:choice-of-anchor J domain-containing protein [Marixanthomonas ophiurae]RFN59765.1 T9SS C-terminal target domain-containing protein [Marixanthomonas ophiurae]